MSCGALWLFILLAGCSSLLPEDSNCPDKLRPSYVSFGPKNQDEQITKVDDCLRQFIGKLAQGSSSDADVARAGVTYCGSFEWIPVPEPEASELQKREQSLALYITVTDRALKCHVPAERQLDGKLP
jgi:hypothetical protein